MVVRSFEFRPTLSKQETNPDTRQVESIKPSLNFVVYLACVVRSLPLEHTLRDGGDSRVMPPLDVLQKLCELGIVIPDLRRPNDPRGLRVIPATVCSRCVETRMSATGSPLLNRNPHLSTPGVTQTSVERWVWHRLREVS